MCVSDIIEHFTLVSDLSNLSYCPLTHISSMLGQLEGHILCLGITSVLIYVHIHIMYTYVHATLALSTTDAQVTFIC